MIAAVKDWLKLVVKPPEGIPEVVDGVAGDGIFDLPDIDLDFGDDP